MKNCFASKSVDLLDTTIDPANWLGNKSRHPSIDLIITELTQNHRIDVE